MTQTKTVYRQFLVGALGYWGRGETVAEAAEACRKAGCKRSAHAFLDLFQNTNRPPMPMVENMLTVSSVEGSDRITIGTFTLGALLNSK